MIEPEGDDRNPYAAPVSPLRDVALDRGKGYRLTLADLLVCVAIIAVFIALLIPAMSGPVRSHGHGDGRRHRDRHAEGTERAEPPSVRPLPEEQKSVVKPGRRSRPYDKACR